MKADRLDNLFAAARCAPARGSAGVPIGFADRIVQQYQKQQRENQTFLWTSIVSIGITLVILGASFGYNFEASSHSGMDDQESLVELPFALWDPAGN